MYEQLLSAGTGKKIYHFPESGPGPKTVRSGDDQIGFFGEVTDLELFQPWEIAVAGKLYSGTELTPSGGIWLKFIYKGKFLFIPKQQFRLSISYQDLYASGLVYGVDGDGKYPAGPGTYQLVQMTKQENDKTWVLKPRLLTGAATDPATGTTEATTLDSEWTQLLGRCYEGSAGNVQGKFANYTFAQLGFGNRTNSWTQNSLTTNTAQAYIRGGNNALDAITGATPTVKTDNAVTSGWRPVLELIPANLPKLPYNITDKTYGNYPVSILNFVQPTDAIESPIFPHQAPWPYAIPCISQYPTYPDSLTNPTWYYWTSVDSDIDAFTISVSHV